MAGLQKMTPKRFVRANLKDKNTSKEFIEKHRSFLNSFQFLEPILSAYDAGKILPTPTLQACQATIFENIIASEIKTSQAQIDKALNVSGTKIIRKSDKEDKKPAAKTKDSGYTITVMVKDQDGNGNVVGEKVGEIDRRVETEDGKVLIEKEPAIFSTKDYGSAEGKADRVLFSLQNALYALIENNAGQKVVTKIPRSDAIARTLKPKPGASSKRVGGASGPLKGQMKVSNDRCSFSRG